MVTSIAYWGYTGMYREKKMETAIVCWGYMEISGDNGKENGNDDSTLRTVLSDSLSTPAPTMIPFSSTAIFVSISIPGFFLSRLSSLLSSLSRE